MTSSALSEMDSFSQALEAMSGSRMDGVKSPDAQSVDASLGDRTEGVARLPPESWTEHQTFKTRYLSTAEAASLIVNKMIGTGIFTTPGLVLASTGDKWLALGLWIAGGVYAAICLFVYLDYGTGLPFNGAELIYLNRVFSYAKFELLPPVLFASYFVFLYHTAGNALAFSRFVLITGIAESGDNQYHLSGALVKGLAVLVLAVVCFLLWLHPKTGLVLSKAFAAFKIILLFALGFWGIALRDRTDVDGVPPTQDWGDHDTSGNRSISRIAGFIYVIYSYGGWESACYVLGQFDKTDKNWMRKIRWGAMAAVFLVSAAYVVLVVGFFESCTYDDIIKNQNQSDLGIASEFADKVLKNPSAVKVCIALSGFGNLVAVAYTSTQVKQAIALHHFLPCSTFLSSDRTFGTPGGALLLHWIISSIFLLSVPPNADGYAFLIGLLTYGQLVVAGLIGLGRFKLKRTIVNAKLDFEWAPWLPSNTINYCTGFFLFLINFLLCIASVWPVHVESNQPADRDSIPTYLWLVVVAAFVTGGLLYWCGLLWLQHGLGDWLGWKFYIETTEEESDLDKERRRTRRDGTEKRYRYYEIQRGSKAYMIQGWWNRFWNYLGDLL